MDYLFPSAPELFPKPICFKEAKWAVPSELSDNAIIPSIRNNKITKCLRANTLLRSYGHNKDSFGLVRQAELQILQKELSKQVRIMQSTKISWINKSWKASIIERSCQVKKVSAESITKHGWVFSSKRKKVWTYEYVEKHWWWFRFKKVNPVPFWDF